MAWSTAHAQPLQTEEGWTMHERERALAREGEGKGGHT
jgi:hypothetical protein